MRFRAVGIYLASGRFRALSKTSAQFDSFTIYLLYTLQVELKTANQLETFQLMTWKRKESSEYGAASDGSALSSHGKRTEANSKPIYLGPISSSPLSCQNSLVSAYYELHMEEEAALPEHDATDATTRAKTYLHWGDSIPCPSLSSTVEDARFCAWQKCARLDFVDTTTQLSTETLDMGLKHTAWKKPLIWLRCPTQ